MASLWRDSRTPYHVACFTAFIGHRRVQLKRSTHLLIKGETPAETKANAKLARRIAEEMEDGCQGRRSAEETKLVLSAISDLRTRHLLERVFDKVLKKTTGRGLGGKATRTFIKSWLERTTQGAVAPSTLATYQRAADLFLESLGKNGDEDLSRITREDIEHFRNQQGKRVSTTTANLFVKVVRMILNAALEEKLVSENVARKVGKLNPKAVRGNTSDPKRRPFTLPELQKLLGVCDPEWRSLILFGFYTGARLGDLAALTWSNLDLQRNEVTYTSRKTNRTVIVPLSNTLRAQIDILEAGDDPKQPLHPRAFATLQNEGRTGSLSRQFGDLLASAGLIAPRTEEKPKSHKARKQGRSARRTMSEISFHALRHTAVSLLKSAGVGDAVAQDLAGHDSAEMSRLYTHIDDGAKRDAVNRLPAIGSVGK
jgi:integrase